MMLAGDGSFVNNRTWGGTEYGLRKRPYAVSRRPTYLEDDFGFPLESALEPLRDEEELEVLAFCVVDTVN